MTQPLPLRTRFDFLVDGTPVVGTLHSPADGSTPIARAVVTGPLTSVKEQSAAMYATALASRGYEALAFDHRYFGESGGEPRQFENPFAKVEDLKGAGTALEGRGGPALPTIGVGICVGAGYMSRAVAEDGRFKGFAGVAGVYGAAALNAETSPQAERGRAAEERFKATGQAESIPAVGSDGGDIAMPLREAYEYYGTPRGAVPNYTNRYAVQSFAYTGRFDSQGAAPLIKVPVIVIHSDKALAPALARSFVDKLTAPHELLWLESQGQIDFYDDPRLVNAATDAIVSFFKREIAFP